MKRQSYTIEFNTPQQDIEVLMYNVGKGIDGSHKTFVGNNILTGHIVEGSSTLSEDGLTLVVERDWTDNVHSDWEAMNIDIVTPVEALDIVVSCVHSFTDI
jgi:hypothetical protein